MKEIARKVWDWSDKNLMFVTAGLLVFVVMFMSGQLGSNSAETLSGRIALIVGYVTLITAGVTMIARRRELENGWFKNFVGAWILVLLVLEIFASLSFILANDASTEAKHSNYKLNQLERALASSEQSVAIAQQNWKTAIDNDSKYQTRRFNQYQDAVSDHNKNLSKYEKMSAKYTASSLVVYERIALLLDNSVSAKTIQFVMRSLFMIAISVTVIVLVSMLSQLKERKNSDSESGSGGNSGEDKTEAEDVEKALNERELVYADSNHDGVYHSSVNQPEPRAVSEVQTKESDKYLGFLGELESHKFDKLTVSSILSQSDYVNSNATIRTYLEKAAHESDLVECHKDTRGRMHYSYTKLNHPTQTQTNKLHTVLAH